MPKTITTANVLAEEIATLQEAIATTERDFLEQMSENAEFAEALRLFSANVAQYVPEGRIPMMDALTNVLHEASNQEDRQYRLNACQRALTVGQEAVARLSSEIAQLRQQLAIAESELDWRTNYQPFVERYKDGFTMPSPEQRKQERVEALQRDISERQEKLGRARSWLSQPEGSRSYYAGDPLREVSYLQEAIPILEGQLQRLISEPVGEDPKYDQAFRQYVKARVAVEPALSAFLEVQGEYLEALSQFKEAIAANPIAAEFPSAALSKPRIVSGDDSIRLV